MSEFKPETHVAEEDILDAEVAPTGERMDLTKAHHV
jgi:hypothetical protein